MTAPVKISEKLLNEKIMDLLHTRASCIDARSVMLELVDDPAVASNWRIGHFDPGRGDRYTCKTALRAIHESLQGQFEMVGRS
jgi:hypothetical protein